MNNSIIEALGEMRTQSGDTVKSLTDQQPVMLVFLRHFGCTFCMEAMRDIAKQRAKIENRNVLICMVHMADNDIAEGYFEEYNLKDITHVSDPDCTWYERFGLLKGNFGQLFGLRVWLRTAERAIKDIRSIRRKQIGDGFQMPGVFLISRGQIIESYIHTRASDRPDYVALSACCQR